MLNTTMPISTHFIGRSRSVCGTFAMLPARVAARPLLTPETMDLRRLTSAHRPPTSIAPTPR